MLTWNSCSGSDIHISKSLLFLWVHRTFARKKLIQYLAKEQNIHVSPLSCDMRGNDESDFVILFMIATIRKTVVHRIFIFLLLLYFFFVKFSLSSVQMYKLHQKPTVINVYKQTLIDLTLSDKQIKQSNPKNRSNRRGDA